ncbi:zinc-binding dehydrogenase [Saccharopolyspora sp. NPDC050642]|uniref:zinc-binding dehydrogenase n=1 Tax=Saccharopolyspora sp. NPDC050642 TaxID=3157099 RepID=UPI00340081F9
MRVVRVSEFGGPEVLVAGEAPDPVAGAGQVVIGVEVAAIDFVQTQLRQGFSPGPPLPELPYVPGATVAGTVFSAGDGVDASWTGRRVVAHTADGLGGNAEKAVADEDALFPVPDGLGLAQAAALFDDGATAIGLAENAAIKPGEWVLVEAAGGGVGSLLVQLACAAGARVIGAARGERKRELVLSLGAELAVDYSESGWREQVLAATDGRGPDLVFDGIGGTIGREAFELTARGGRFSVHGASSGAPSEIDGVEAGRREVTVIGLDQLFGFAATARPRKERALSQASAGLLTPTIGQTFPLERAADAHAAMQNRQAIGKTLLQVQPGA